ncbi:MAG: LuxR C-terminal-related transcriptional regulator [Acidimicrobiia bacterium]
MSDDQRLADVVAPTAPPLVVAKTRTPIARRGLVRRAAVVDRLADQSDRRVTVVQAPAGFGKSTALMGWATSDSLRRFGWLTLEDSENDPALLWRYIVFTLRALAPGLADRAWALLHSAQPDLNTVIAHVLNSLLDIPGRLVLVLDDYHVLTEAECHRSVQYFIDHAPLSMQVALGTRSSPPLSLSRLEARGLTLTIGPEALRFTPDEAREVLEKIGDRSGPKHATQVYERTEGWPVGVYLAAIARDEVLTSGTADQGDRSIRIFLMEQMIEQLSEHDRTLLTAWSVLPHLNGGLCDYVSERIDSASTLERLSHSNLLLMPLDAPGGWYRLHDLLAEALRIDFNRLPAADSRHVHRRAMEWWIDAGDIAQAIHHALEAGEYESASEVITMNWLEYLTTGWIETLRAWIERIPDNDLLAYPPVLVAAAWIASFSGDAHATRQFASAARGASFDGAMVDGSASYESAVAIMDAGLALNGLTQAKTDAELAYHLEPADSAVRPLAASILGASRFGLGELGAARTALIEAAGVPAGVDGIAVYAKGQLALLEMTAGNWDKGAQLAADACEQSDSLRLNRLLPSCGAQVARAASTAHNGDLGLARQQLGSMAGVFGTLSDAAPYDAFQAHVVVAETHAKLGDYRAARIHAQTAATHLRAIGDGGIFEDRLTALESLLAQAAEGLATNDPPEPLTNRELEILERLPSGLSLRDIGDELFISRNTAKTHVASIYRKLDVTGRTAAVTRAQQLDLI